MQMNLDRNFLQFFLLFKGFVLMDLTVFAGTALDQWYRAGGGAERGSVPLVVFVCSYERPLLYSLSIALSI